MSRLASILARALWGHLLWLMRRPWMKRLQRRSLRMLPSGVQGRAHASTVRQNRFARRYGLRMLSVSINLLLASVLITVCYQTVLYMQESGTLTVPDAIRERAESGQN